MTIVFCSCSWALNVLPHDPPSVVRATIRMAIVKMRFHWEMGHQLSASRAVCDFVADEISALLHSKPVVEYIAPGSIAAVELDERLGRRKRAAEYPVMTDEDMDEIRQQADNRRRSRW